MISTILQSAAALIMSLAQPNGDTVPDFSRVGYRWGDKEIPEYKVVRLLRLLRTVQMQQNLFRGQLMVCVRRERSC